MTGKADHDVDRHVKQIAQRPVTTAQSRRVKSRWWARCWPLPAQSWRSPHRYTAAAAWSVALLVTLV